MAKANQSAPAKATKASPTSKTKRVPKPTRTTVDVAGGELIEPDWARLLPEPAEQAAASEHWLRVVEEMRDRETLSASNGHALQRLVLAYLHYDGCSLMVAQNGLVTEPNPNNPKSIARLSIYYKAMREAEKTADALEAQLGLSPGRRGRVGKVTKKRERSAGADAFLGPKG
jgi:P27 family predicted phage terminase small subunit